MSLKKNDKDKDNIPKDNIVKDKDTYQSYQIHGVLQKPLHLAFRLFLLNPLC